MKQKIESVIWKAKKNKTPRHSSKKEKKDLKNEESLRNILDMKHNINHLKNTRRRKESKGLRTYLKT